MAPLRRTDGRLNDEAVLKYAAAVLVGFLVVGGLLVGASAVFGPDHTPTRSRTSSDPTPSSLPSSAEPGSATPSPSPSRAMTKQGMTAFVSDYLDTVTSDPRKAWRSLTPAFQRHSGGYASYQRFWGSIRSARPSGIFADPAEAKVTYTVRYQYAGGRVGTDSTRLRLVLRDGTYLIKGEG